MVRFYSFIFLQLILLAVSCSTNLENSREYLAQGNRAKATEVLLRHVRENDVYTLSEPEYKTGIDFVNLLVQLDSPELLIQVYDLKFSELSREKNVYIFSGRLANEILNLSIKWRMEKLQDRLAERIENEIVLLKRNERYKQEFIQFASFAAIRLSQNKLSHTNLSQFWLEIPHENFLTAFRDLWKQAKALQANSVLTVLKDNLCQKLQRNSQQILELADPKELSLIAMAEEDCRNESAYITFKQLIDKRLRDDSAESKIAQDELVQLNPELVKAQDKLRALEMERSGLQAKNLYTFEKAVQCGNCRGAGNVTCGGCQGSRTCNYCDHGQVICGRCRGFSFLNCGSCCGRGFYYESVRAWDSCHRRHYYTSLRVSCHSCFGMGTIRCGCLHGRVICGRCRGSDLCQSCNGQGAVDCVSCVGGQVIEIHKTQAGIEMDTKISAAESQYSALFNRYQFLDRLVRRHSDREKNLSAIFQLK